jgi:ribosome recycling factor
MNTVKEIETAAKQRMEKALEDLQHAMATIRTGRASVHLLDNVRVDYYGTPTPVNQVASLHVPEPGMITITPWDVTQIGPIEKAIRAADLGVNPANDGKIIRIPIPPLNEERRKELVKKLHGVAEDHRVAIRNIRRDSNDHVKKLAKEKKIEIGARRFPVPLADARGSEWVLNRDREGAAHVAYLTLRLTVIFTRH